MWDLIWASAKHDKGWAGLVVIWWAQTIIDMATGTWILVPFSALILALTILGLVNRYMIFIGHQYITALENELKQELEKK